ncbi:MAG TPA: zinc-ribbon domain-containing protein [Candidatus Gemmiger faecigallinarum]|nr:zinc-ribbon domain-containing protein [Candidatus Gemmiger faecigallinarum]
MKAWFQRFMSGRYGGDQFSQFLSILSLILLVLGLFTWGIFYYIGLALLIYSYFRMFSRNIQKRYAENQWFLTRTAGIRSWFAHIKVRFAQRKTYRYFNCPHCKQAIRVPKGRGRISITCPKCQTQFIRKS